MIIAIDGPAGAGKSTTARALAKALGWSYIDTGAMYRAVALTARENGVIADDGGAIASLAESLPLHFSDKGERIWVGDRDVSGEIRTPEIGDMTSQISAHAGLREIIVALQRRLAREDEDLCGGAVLEGRDIQTVVFPDAPIKIFLSADARTRATRRGAEWNDDVEAAVRDIEARDQRDSSRANSPLCAAPDAVHLSTDGLSTEEIVEQIVALVRSKTSATSL
ncbi:MAG TPA: (d)CMP kinase [Abditibacteriaceae bacterium]|jgi:cytidylate kinase